MPMPKPPLKPDLFQILLALEQEELHGYGIIKAVEANTGGQVRPEASPLYRRLKRLLDGGVIRESTERPVAELDDERRRYYALTERGRALVAAEARRLVDLAADRRVRDLAEQAETSGG